MADDWVSVGAAAPAPPTGSGTGDWVSVGGTAAPAKAPFSVFGTKPVGDPVFNAVVAPAINTLDYPVRAVAGDIAGTIPGVGAIPTDQASREKWQRIRDKVIAATELPESDLGKAISSIIAIPGQVISGGARAASEATLGKATTDALSPYAQTAMDVLPFVGRTVGAARGAAGLPAEMKPTPAAQAAHGAGYRLAPEEISQQPSFWSRALAAVSGKIKKYQALSEENQSATNKLAAQSIGLPTGTVLNEAAFDRARDQAGSVYREVDNAVPQIATAADPEFRTAVGNVGRRAEVLERGFPEEALTPSIAQLRQDLLAQPFQKPEAVRRKIAELRSDAGRNLRNRTDAQAHHLGMAQRQAASALEDAVERSVRYGPAQISAMNELYGAEQQVAAAHAALNGQTTTAPAGGMPAAMARLDQARTALVQASIADPQRAVMSADLINRYRQARQLFARTYDIELATNPATGDVSARRISALRSGAMKRPLAGEMKQIADTYDAFPRAMQDPARFGHLEDWSILDAYGAGAALFGGHPGAAAAILGRNPLRSFLVSPTAQNRMFNRSRPISTPLSGYAVGTAAEPQLDPLAQAMRALRDSGTAF